MHPCRGRPSHGTGNSSDHAYSASSTHQVPMRPAVRVTECCGTDPTNTQNGSPSRVRRASHSLSSDRKYRHTHRLQYPSPLKYECGLRASVHLSQGSTLLRGMRVRCRPDTHAFHRHLPVSPDGQMPRSFRLYSKYLCCFSRFCHARYCGNPDLYVPLSPAFPDDFSLPVQWLRRLPQQRSLPHLMLHNFSLPYQ